MKLWMALSAAASGYLIGSLSFARIMMRLVAPDRAYQKIRREVAGSDRAFEGVSVSANSVREQLGSRYGCLTALLDASKAALPALVFRLWQPDAPYSLIAATLAMVGHIYPVYHGFRGGMGLSTMYGGFFVLDWLGVIVTTLIGTITGILIEQVLVFRWSGILFMIPWIWLRTRDPLKLLYVVVANVLYWTAMIPELRQYFAFKSEGTLPDQAEIADLLGMRGAWEAVGKYSLPALFRRRKED
jgi:glycerol-3-phosphate acyltransferase PlsY